MKTPLQILIDARALIDSPEKWIKGWYEKVRNDIRCNCAMGAIMRAAGDCITAEQKARETLIAALPKPSLITLWNDAPERTHAEVLEAFSRAIELARIAEAQP